MYDVEKLVSIVCDYLDAEADYMKYSLDARKDLGLAPDSALWIPSLNGSKAYRLGEQHFGRHLRYAEHQSGIAGGRCQIHATQGTP